MNLDVETNSSRAQASTPTTLSSKQSTVEPLFHSPSSIFLYLLFSLSLSLLFNEKVDRIIYCDFGRLFSLGITTWHGCVVRTTTTKIKKNAESLSALSFRRFVVRCVFFSLLLFFLFRAFLVVLMLSIHCVGTLFSCM